MGVEYRVLSFKYEPNMVARRRRALAAYRDSQLDALAHSEEANYEQNVAAVAEDLGMSIPKIDAEMVRRREPDRWGHEPKPWDEPVDGIRLLREICTIYERHIFTDEKNVFALALWTIFAHVHDSFHISPILLLASPTKGCGKTRIVTILTKLAPRPKAFSNVTPASVFHTIERHNPTLILDEVDSYKDLSGEIRGILNSGHDRAAASIARAKRDYSTWCPKVLAMIEIGHFPATLEHRAIKIDLYPKPESAQIRDIPKEGNVYINVYRRIRRWVLDNERKLAGYVPEMPSGLDDRVRDNWTPLAAIADIIGGKWPARVRKACEQISRVRVDEDPLVLLLQDICTLFDHNRGRDMSSTELVSFLNRQEHRPWSDFHNGKPITGRGIAVLLKRLKVQPSQVAVGDKRPNGYKREWFEKWFERYRIKGKP